MRWRSHILLGLAIAFLAVAPAIFGTFTITLMNYIGIYAFAALGLVLLTGVGGLTSFGQAAFVGIGAYATAWYTAVQAARRGSGCCSRCCLTGLAATVPRRGDAAAQRAFPAAEHHRLGHCDLFRVRQSRCARPLQRAVRHPADPIGPISLGGNIAIYFFIWVCSARDVLCSNLLDSGRAGRSAACAAASPWWKVSPSTAFGCGLRSSFWPGCSPASPAGSMPTCNASSTRRRSTFAPASSSCSWRWSAAPATSPARWSARPSSTCSRTCCRTSSRVHALQRAARKSLFGVLFIVLLQKARGGVVPMIRRFLPRPTFSAGAGIAARPPNASDRLAAGRCCGSRRHQAVRRIGGSQRGELRGQTRRGAGSDRPERRRQDHAAQSDHRDGKAERRADRVPRRRRNALAPRHIAAKGMARTFQHVKLRPNMTLLDNVLLGTYPRTRSGFFAGAAPPRPSRRTLRAARGAAATKARRPRRKGSASSAGNLPLGQQRLLEVARALAADPVVVILDEPAAGLRRLEKQTLSDLLRSLRDAGMTIVLVEHDMEFVMNLVDRIVVMDFGAKLAEGPARRYPRRRARAGSLSRGRRMTALLVGHRPARQLRQGRSRERRQRSTCRPVISSP